MTETVKLDIACGTRKHDGFVGIDMVPGDDVDLVHDLEVFPWPIADESVSEAICQHYVEHTSDLIAFMEECYRILVPGGVLTIIAPYYTSIRAWQDPTHKRVISELSFVYFNREWREREKLDHYPITCDFDAEYAHAFYPGLDWHTKPQAEQEFAIAHFWNVVADIQFRLTKR